MNQIDNHKVSRTVKLVYSDQFFHLAHWSPALLFFQIAKDKLFANTTIIFRVKGEEFYADHILSLIVMAGSCYCGREVQIAAKGDMASVAVDYYSKLFGCATESEMRACARSFDLLDGRPCLRQLVED